MLVSAAHHGSGSLTKMVYRGRGYVLVGIEAVPTAGSEVRSQDDRWSPSN